MVTVRATQSIPTESSSLLGTSPSEKQAHTASTSRSSFSSLTSLVGLHVPDYIEADLSGALKGIGFWGSIAIAVNNLTGPGMLDLPSTFQKSGLIPTTICIIVIATLSSITSLSLSNAIGKIKGNGERNGNIYEPRNSGFQHAVEYSTAFQYYRGQKAFMITQISFFLCIMSQAVASIITTAQVVDAIIASIHGKTYGLSIQNFRETPEILSWSPVSCQEDLEDVDPESDVIIDYACMPFDGNKFGDIVLSAGYIVTAICLAPFGLMDMKENVNSQLLSFWLLLVFLLEFVVSFFFHGFNFSNISLFGSDWSELLGVILFNFALTATMPSWLHEKAPTTSVSKIVWTSSIMVVVLYIFVGVSGAVAIHHVPSNFLAYLSSGEEGYVTQICADLFSFFIIGLGIPLFCIIMRYNMVNGGVTNEATGMFLTSVLPWCIAWLLYKGDGIVQVLSWGGLILNGAVAFIFPLFIALDSVYEPNPDFEGGIGKSGSPHESKRVDEDEELRDFVVDAFGGWELIRTKKHERWALTTVLVFVVFVVSFATAGKFGFL